ncbi:hypothetical protein [Micromonospora sp. NBS 11-29]|uniref:hypothetical protein n=1 Tax=Micromonospora sp. NBS 11-29 TaxID=1960879 RepID=UPI000B76FA9A|nr:hypothetical protein [Micromonospora sp. NBS 11-29]
MSPSESATTDTGMPPARREPLTTLRADLGKGRLKPLAIDLGTWSSTATLFENLDLEPRGLDPAQEVVARAGLRDLLAERDLAAAVADTLAERRDYLGEEHSRRVPDPPTVAWLIEALGRHAEQGGREFTAFDKLVRHLACDALDVALARDEQLARRYAPGLHRLWDAVYATPALRNSSLWPLGLRRPAFRDAEIRSVLATNLHELTRTDLVDELGSGRDRTTAYFPGVKRWLGRWEAVPELAGVTCPAGWQPDSELLLALAYSALVRRADEAVGHAGERESLLSDIRAVAERPVDDLAVTYPTITPPSVRQRLGGFVADALGLPVHRVHLEYDEAVAAGLYFVMRGFGGDVGAGIRAFRASATAVADAQRPTWRRNMLVVDVGGGTTDIAMLAVELVDVTDGPAEPAGSLVVRGRRYHLRPRVLGTTGHGQLGGDLLTLRLFYLLKAAIVDASDEPADDAPGPLVGQLLLAEGSGPAPYAVREKLREALPTHTEPGSGSGAPRRTQEFDALWRAAEKAKTDFLSANEPYALPAVAIADGLPDGPVKATLDALTRDVVLDPEHFERLLRPLLDSVAGLAAGLVVRTLDAEPGQRLDEIALCGRTTGMPLVRALMPGLLSRRLAESGAGRAVEWDALALTVEQRYAKQAASIGAAWGRGISQVGSVDAGHLDAGLDTLTHRVDNLLLTLPADFGLAALGGLPQPWLRCGRRFDKTHADGRLFLRSEWRPLVPDIQLHRLLGEQGPTGRSVEWGRFEYARHRGGGRLPADVWFQIEIDQSLVPRIFLCRGTATAVRPVLHPTTGRDRDSRFAVSLLDHPELRDCVVDGRLARVPRITVAAVGAAPAQAPPAPVEVFAGGPAEQVFDVDLATDGPRVGDASWIGSVNGSAGWGWPASVAGGTATPGVVSPVALPDPPDGGPVPERFVFWADSDTGKPVPIGELEPPRTAPRDDGEALDLPFWAILNERGELRVHSGYPVYLPAQNLETMETKPGFVCTLAFDPGVSDRNPDWDPFTGEH